MPGTEEIRHTHSFKIQLWGKMRVGLKAEHELRKRALTLRRIQTRLYAPEKDQQQGQGQRHKSTAKLLRVPGRQNPENGTILGQTKNPAAKPEEVRMRTDAGQLSPSRAMELQGKTQRVESDPMLLLPCEGRTGPAAGSAGGRRGSRSAHS